ncbi:hypothetical protein PSRA_1373 [Pseudoscardovia radai]|uniref:DUF3073 domain-containing protein n=1 Tax=Pseudoscardovia radai TaxID=987066 RepID=A0A261EVW9_9BIFI|nr:hypothetical protein PSRA_1373 [Pseudoscardovia radai]
MGRGRQKAKQTKIARKLKYLTTDTDYDKLAEELAHQDEEQPSAADPFADIVDSESEGEESSVADTASSDELDEYAKWAEEAARKAEEQPKAVKPLAPHKPFPMPKPGAFSMKTAPSKPGKPGGAASKKSAESAAAETDDSAK